MDFSEFFERYEALADEVETLFEKIKAAHPEEVRCEPGCDDCCYALFDLSLIEALHLNAQFNEKFTGGARSAILQRADKADRETYRLKRAVFKASQEGRKAADILAEVAAMRVRCPLLNDENRCDLYEHRPLTCRLYGAPTAINGQAHTCGKAGFQAGQKYPTVDVGRLQDKLFALSKELVETMPTRHTRMADVLVPLSMALMNRYDDDYLGLTDEPPAAAAGPAMGASFSRGGPAPTQAPSPCGSESACGGSHDWYVPGPEKERHAPPGGIGDLRPPADADQSAHGPFSSKDED